MRIFNTFLALLTISSSSFAFDEADKYFDMSLEELMNIKVSGVTRKETNTFKETSAVFVITNDEIRRFGATSIPELLQMVPGFNVGRLSSNMWSINARGQAGRQARDLLLMIDGRNLYSPTVNNVYWDHIDTILEDIERIEIIRGPGSSLWGSNAANGIINIVTKHSSDTKDFMGYAQAATEHTTYDVGARFGIVEDKYSARIYAKKTQLKKSEYPKESEQSRKGRFTAGDEAHDGKTLSLAGVRADFDLDDNTNLMINAEFMTLDTQEVKNSSFSSRNTLVEQDGAYIISALDITHSKNSRSKLQMYVDYFKRMDVDLLDERTVYDIDFQNEIITGDLTTLWGLGYRYVDHKTKHTGDFFAFALNPEQKDLKYISGFLNFDYKMFNDKLLLTFGSKYEHNPYTDSEFMPNIRLGYYPNENHTLWASISRTTSIPSRTLEDAYLDLSSIDNSQCGLFGGVVDPELGCIININSSQNNNASNMNVFELGYRIKLNKNINIDQTVYHNEFRNNNSEQDDLDYIQGYEISVDYFPRDYFKIHSFYSLQNAKNLSTAIRDLEEYIPKNTFGLRTSYDFNKNTEFDIFYRYVSHVNDIDPINQLNLRFGYKISKSLEGSLFLSNLLDKNHVESNSDSLRANSSIQRAALIKLTYRY